MGGLWGGLFGGLPDGPPVRQPQHPRHGEQQHHGCPYTAQVEATFREWLVEEIAHHGAQRSRQRSPDGLRRRAGERRGIKHHLVHRRHFGQLALGAQLEHQQAAQWLSTWTGLAVPTGGWQVQGVWPAPTAMKAPEPKEI